MASGAAAQPAPRSGLPLVADRPVAQARLGERLFFDKRLSADGQVACASCHRPELQFTDGRPLAVGVGGRMGTRNTPSLWDVGGQRALFWDGRRASLEAQAWDPLLNPAEHGLADEAAVLGVLRRDRRDRLAFQAAFGGRLGEEVTPARVAQALAAYQRTLVSPPSAFDRYQAQLAHGDAAPTTLTPAQLRGWALFSGAAQCTRCHTVDAPDGQRAPFTDQAFHSLSVGMARVEHRLVALTRQVVALHEDGRAMDRDVLADPDVAALGRFVVTLDPRHIGQFKTPSLRNVALTAPYMHDGSVATLDASVDMELYDRGASNGRPLILTPQERGDLVAFLKALSSEPVAAAPRR